MVKVLSAGRLSDPAIKIDRGTSMQRAWKANKAEIIAGAWGADI